MAAVRSGPPATFRSRANTNSLLPNTQPDLFTHNIISNPRRLTNSETSPGLANSYGHPPSQSIHSRTTDTPRLFSYSRYPFNGSSWFNNSLIRPLVTFI